MELHLVIRWRMVTRHRRGGVEDIMVAKYGGIVEQELEVSAPPFVANSIYASVIYASVIYASVIYASVIYAS